MGLTGSGFSCRCCAWTSTLNSSRFCALILTVRGVPATMAFSMASATSLHEPWDGTKSGAC